jgi:hypothetical protein
LRFFNNFFLLRNIYTNIIPFKYPSVDIESRKGMFFLIGLLIAVSIVIQAFEWRVFEMTTSYTDDMVGTFEEEELIPITRQEIKPPPIPRSFFTFLILPSSITTKVT